MMHELLENVLDHIPACHKQVAVRILMHSGMYNVIFQLFSYSYACAVMVKLCQ